MKKFIIGLMLVLSACTIPGVQIGSGTIPVSPAPLAKTTIDDTALRTAWKSFDVALDAIAILRQKGIIKVGSPTAIKIANGIDRTTAALQAAEHAVATVSTSDYLAALSEAQLALIDIRVAIKGN